jgi:hypothetical protein
MFTAMSFVIVHKIETQIPPANKWTMKCENKYTYKGILFSVMV